MSLKTIGHAVANFVSGFVDGELKPWLKDLFSHVKHDVIDALVPIAHEVIQEVLNDGQKILAGDSIHDVAQGAGAALLNLAKRAEKAGIDAAGHDLVIALGTALNSRNAASTGKPAA